MKSNPPRDGDESRGARTAAETKHARYRRRGILLHASCIERMYVLTFLALLAHDGAGEQAEHDDGGQQEVARPLASRRRGAPAGPAPGRRRHVCERARPDARALLTSRDRLPAPPRTPRRSRAVCA